MVPGLKRLRRRFDAILFDLDGTLLDGRGMLNERTMEAVSAVVDAGFLVIPCTGRSFAGTVPTYKALELDGPMVTYNGNWIGKPDELPLRHIPIPDHSVPHIEEMEQSAHFTFRHFDERKYTLLSSHPEHMRVAAWYENVTATHEPTDLPSSNLMRASLFVEGEIAAGELFASLPDDAREHLHQEVFPLSLFPYYETSKLALCELQGKSRGKAEVFDVLAEMFDIPSRRVVAFGDHRNDKTMLAGAGLSIVPSNAAPEVRPLADLVIGHHADDGVAQWFESGAPTHGARVRR